MDSKASSKKSKKLQLKMIQGDQPELLDKQAAKMVELVRLQLIEQENRSAGALLDTRQLHKLDEAKVKVGNATQLKLDTQKRVESRRNARTQEEVKQVSEKAIKTMMTKGIEIVKTSNYENEELIWHTKSSDPNYSKKRRFDNPALQKFKNNLSAEERMLFKSLCHQALVDLSNKYREEVEKVRSDMDLAGIFHPDANAHRAHCMYLMKLYNGIRADTIEDPVLRKMEHDIEERKKLQEAEERRQRELIASFENKHAGKKEKKGVQETMAQAEAEVEAKRKADETQQAEELEKLRLKAEKESKTKNRDARNNQTRTMQKNKSAPVLLQPLKKVPTNKSLAASASVKAIAASAINPKSGAQKATAKDDGADDESTVSTEDTESVHEKKMSSNDTKLFNKMKRGKMGGVDPRTLLMNEASRLDEADVENIVKVKERSSLVDDKTSAWMLQLLQESQVQKTAEGRDLAPARQGLLPSDTFGASIDSPMKKSHSKEDPQHVIPFNDFYDMFKTFSEEASKEPSQVVEQKVQKGRKGHKASSPAPEAWDSDVPNSDESGILIAPEVVHASQLEKFHPTDTVKELGDVDPQFEAYMKMTRRQSPGGQRLFRGKTGSQAKRRPHNPLGQKAVYITDSRGAATAETTKGFTNIFNMNIAEDDSSEEEVEMENKYISSSHADEDDMSQEHHAVDGVSSSPGAAGAAIGNQDRSSTPSADITGSVGITTTQLGGSGRNSPPGTLRPSRSRRGRSRDNASRGKSGVLAGQNANEEGMDMQSKLIVAFDCLQTPATSRLAYMRKYAQPENATKFNTAIDRLAECAVWAMALEQLVHRNILKLREGYAVLPLLASGLITDFMQNVPALLSSRAPALCIQVSFSDPLRDPASVLALQNLKRSVHKTFPDDRVEDQYDNAMTPETAAELLVELKTNVEAALEKLRVNLLAELDDQLQVQGASLAEWLATFKPKPPQMESKDEKVVKDTKESKKK